jgi:hypothetical protein
LDQCAITLFCWLVQSVVQSAVIMKCQALEMR